jgi:hypothetical protein
MEIPYIGDKALQVLQYVDSNKAQTTGAQLANQGLDADAISRETATRFTGMEEAGEAKIELIARNYAETGFRKLYEGIAWIASRFQDTEAEFRVLGKAMAINPKGWKYDHQVKTTVGLGAGNNEKLVASLQGIYAIQSQLKAQGSTLVDEEDIYATLKRIIDGLGLPSVDEFFNNPEEPDELLKAENEILNATLMQLQEQLQMMQNPLAEAETIKAQAKLIEAQGKGQMEMAKATENQRQYNDTAERKAKQFQEETALKLTDMEMKYGQQLNGEVQANMDLSMLSTEQLIQVLEQ